MNGIDPVATGALAGLAGPGMTGSNTATDTAQAVDSSFLSAITRGLAQVDADSEKASAALTALATNQDIATHDVILAMEQAKLSLQLAAEVRQRLLDAYKELTGMQI